MAQSPQTIRAYIGPARKGDASAIANGLESAQVQIDLLKRSVAESTSASAVEQASTVKIARYASTRPRKLDGKLGESPSVLDWIPTPLHDAILDGSSTVDLTPYIGTAITECAEAGVPLRFPLGTYTVGQAGTATLAWPSANRGYVFLIESSVRLIGEGATIKCSVTDASCPNVFWFRGVDAAIIEGVRVEGIGGTSSNVLYAGSAVLFENCTNCLADRVTSHNMRHCVVAFQSQYCAARACTATKAYSNHSGSHFGGYETDNMVIESCTCYSATDDGDIGYYGVGTGNRVTNSQCYAYDFGDAEKTIHDVGRQGIFIDAGQSLAVVSGCYAYGYFFGIDAKASSSGVMFANNTVEKCRFCMSFRRGEANSPVYNCVMSNNVLRPMGGNGDTTWAVTEGNSFLGGKGDVAAIYVQDAIGAVIQGNIVEASAAFGSGDQGFIGCYITGSNISTQNSALDGVRVIGNTFNMLIAAGSNYTWSTGPAIYVNGNSSCLMRRVIVSSNNLKVWDGDTLTYSPITLNYCSRAVISGNAISLVYSDRYVIELDGCEDTAITGNTLDTNKGAIKATSCSRVTVTGNIMGATARDSSDTPPPIIYSVGSTHWVVTGNIKYQTPGAASDGPFFGTSSSGTSDVIVRGNVVEKGTYTGADWCQVNGTNTPVQADVAIGANLLNGVFQDDPIRNGKAYDHLVPNANNTYDIGTDSPLKYWRMIRSYDAKFYGNLRVQSSGSDSVTILDENGVERITVNDLGELIAYLIRVSTLNLPSTSEGYAYVASNHNVTSKSLADVLSHLDVYTKDEINTMLADYVSKAAYDIHTHRIPTGYVTQSDGTPAHTHGLSEMGSGAPV